MVKQMNKKQYIAPQAELVLICGKTLLTDDNIGMAGGSNANTVSDPDPDFAKRHDFSDDAWEDADGVWGFQPYDSVY